MRESLIPKHFNIIKLNHRWVGEDRDLSTVAMVASWPCGQAEPEAVWPRVPFFPSVTITLTRFPRKLLVNSQTIASQITMNGKPLSYKCVKTFESPVIAQQSLVLPQHWTVAASPCLCCWIRRLLCLISAWSLPLPLRGTFSHFWGRRES